jgi:hypothetical protein
VDKTLTGTGFAYQENSRKPDVVKLQVWKFKGFVMKISGMDDLTHLNCQGSR